MAILLAVPTTPTPKPLPAVTPNLILSNRRNFTLVLGKIISTSLRGMFLNSFM